MQPKGDIAVIGLAVMGQNLILNMADNGFTVAAFNRTVSKVDDFVNGAAKGYKNVIGVYSIEEMVQKLKAPRKVMLMVKAGSAVDDFIEKLLPHMQRGDVIIDGGNSNFNDTIRRTRYLEEKKLLFVGTGVSGGEEGARKGPSIMPGGSPEAWPLVKDIFQTISAKAPDGAPCCEWVGANGAGHFVKMVHNGIEYGDMQLIGEAYHLMKEGLGLTNDEMYTVFADWNSGDLDSYLIEITRDILSYKDENGIYTVDTILDSAGQKGTGKWTAVNSLEAGVPVTLIAEAVYARYLSALKDERMAASEQLKGPCVRFDFKQSAAFIEDIRKALLASKIVSYAQGFMLLREAAQQYRWNLDYGDIALMWRGGCIIRSAFLDKIKVAYEKNPGLKNLLLDDYFKHIIQSSQDGWRRVVCEAVKAGIPVPAFSTALSFYDGYRAKRLPANMIQAQRDYFGAHTYERADKPRGEFFHTNWTGHGGDTPSSTYSA